MSQQERFHVWVRESRREKFDADMRVIRETLGYQHAGFSQIVLDGIGMLASYLRGELVRVDPDWGIESYVELDADAGDGE